MGKKKKKRSFDPTWIYYLLNAIPKYGNMFMEMGMQGPEKAALAARTSASEESSRLLALQREVAKAKHDEWLGLAPQRKIKVEEDIRDATLGANLKAGEVSTYDERVAAALELQGNQAEAAAASAANLRATTGKTQAQTPGLTAGSDMAASTAAALARLEESDPAAADKMMLNSQFGRRGATVSDQANQMRMAQSVLPEYGAQWPGLNDAYIRGTYPTKWWRNDYELPEIKNNPDLMQKVYNRAYTDNDFREYARMMSEQNPNIMEGLNMLWGR